MTFDADRLYTLLPAVDRIRDAERGEPLRALLRVIASQVAVLEENLDQRYDDHFIETCAEWVVPYIGDLLGVRSLQPVPSATFSDRSEVANTIAYRRRKGTAAMLQRLANDVTGWDARVVEYFRLLATTQYLNHLRPDHPGTPGLRAWEALTYVGTPFDSLPHAADVRRIATGRGRFNIPNVGLHLWRLGAQGLHDATPVKVDARRYLFNPLGAPVQLVTRPVPQDPVIRPADRLNVPMPIGRRCLDAHVPDYYGPGKSIHLVVDGAPVPPGAVAACDLSDDAGAWAHQPQVQYGIDPVLGRLAIPTKVSLPKTILVTYHYAFGADIGGGEYGRAATFGPIPGPPKLVPGGYANVTAALAAVSGGGIVEVANSRTYAETPALAASVSARVEVRAADGVRPTVLLGGDFIVAGGDDADITLNGLVIAGGTVRVRGTPRHFRLRHCTLVPGIVLDPGGNPVQVTTPSLVIEAPDVEVEIESSILGGVRAVIGSTVRLTNTVVDATAEQGIAYAALDGAGPAGALWASCCTIVGKVHADQAHLITNSILLASLGAGDTWRAPVWTERCQAGCVRFSYVPVEAIVPRRFDCVPNESADPLSQRPQFTSLRYGDPGYSQLDDRAPAAIRLGAEDGSEMGAFHDVFQVRREDNLRTRLDEYVRFGLEAGIFHAT